MHDLSGIDLVIFDCDGVLVDSEPLSNQVLAAHASAMGWHMDGPTSQSLFKGMTMKQIHVLFEKRRGESLSEDWINQYYQDSFALFKADLQPVKGVEALIKRVKASGRKICVASQGPMEKMRLTLGVTGLWDYFDGNVFSAHDVARPKPFPDLFLHAANMMNCAPAKCCVIEDSETGLKAAHAAKMDVIYYSPESKLPSDTQTLITHMDEVLAVLRS